LISRTLLTSVASPVQHVSKPEVGLCGVSSAMARPLAVLIAESKTTIILNVYTTTGVPMIG